MAANVRIENQAFSDLRFRRLGGLLGTSEYDALGRMAHLWRQCTQEGKYALTEEEIATICDPEAIIQAGLGERVDGKIRLRGTGGRIEWLKNLRKSSKKGGLNTKAKWKAKRPSEGRPDGPRDGGPDEGHMALGAEGDLLGPTTTTTTTTTTRENPSDSPPYPPAIDTPKFRAAWSAWQQHRREIKKPLTPTATRQQLAKLAVLGEERAVAAIQHSIANGWQGIFEPNADRQSGRSPPAPMFSGVNQWLAEGGDDPQ